MTILPAVDYYQDMQRVNCSASASRIERFLAMAACAAAIPRLQLALIPPRGA